MFVLHPSLRLVRLGRRRKAAIWVVCILGVMLIASILGMFFLPDAAPLPANMLFPLMGLIIIVVGLGIVPYEVLWHREISESIELVSPNYDLLASERRTRLEGYKKDEAARAKNALAWENFRKDLLVLVIGRPGLSAFFQRDPVERYCGPEPPQPELRQRKRRWWQLKSVQ